MAELAPYFRSVFRFFTLKNWQPFRLESGVKFIIQNGDVQIGRGTHLWQNVRISAVGTPSEPAVVRIGKHSGVGERTMFHARKLIDVGNHVRMSWDVVLLENNYHSNSKGPIVIEDYAWVGCRAIILSGVRVGYGAIVAAGAVVTKDVPSNVMVAGNPARPVRTLDAAYRASNGMIPVPDRK
ncbi:MAG TPA: acyltransferase [Thermoanaerobaculia bacterium]|jgi:acetyltransferase-like isoleucine patch superfamily enzyme|nr:acyltransferase [Thermoanaerobaculia bacterium]